MERREIMSTHMTMDQRRVYKRYIDEWGRCNYFGEICSVADRTNDVAKILTRFGVDYLIDFLFIDHKTQAFVYTAYLAEIRAIDVDSEEFNCGFGTLYLEKKRPTYVVEIYRDLRPQAIDWRKHREQFTLELDEDLIYGLEDDNVAVTDLVYPFAKTALNEVMQMENQLSLF